MPLLPKVKEEMLKGSSLNELTVNLIAVGFGTGLLSLPWGVAGASASVAIVLNAIVLVLTAWTIKVIIEAGERYQKFDLGSLLECIPGPAGQAAKYFINVSIATTSILALIGYMIVIYDALQPMLPTSGFFSQRSHIILAAGACVVPVCFLKQEDLAFTSMLCFATHIYLSGLLSYLVVGAYETSSLSSDVCLLGFSFGGMTYFSMIMYSVSIQMCVLPMYQELRGRSPALFCTALTRAFCVLFVFFSFFATASYALYGGSVTGDAWREE